MPPTRDSNVDCGCEKVCHCSTGIPTYLVKDAVTTKWAVFRLVKVYQQSYMSEAWFALFEPEQHYEGKLMSPHLQDMLGYIYSPNQSYHIMFAYSVYAMQFGLWQFACMSLSRLTDTHRMQLIADPKHTLRWISHHSNYSVEYHVGLFLHRWFCHAGRGCPHVSNTLDKYL